MNRREKRAYRKELEANNMWDGEVVLENRILAGLHIFPEYEKEKMNSFQLNRAKRLREKLV